MKKIFLLFIYIFLSAFLWADYFYQNDNEIFTLLHLSRTMGKVFPFSTFPVHGSDILKYAQSLQEDPALSFLNEDENTMLDVIILKLEKQRGQGIFVFGNIAAAYEHRFNSGSFMYGEEELPNSLDVHRAYLDFSPILSLYGGIGFFDGIFLALNIDVRKNWNDDFNPSSNFLTKVNVMYDMFTKGIFAWNAEYINFFFGRNSVHWGNPLGSTFYASSLIPHMDNISINVPLGPFTFDYSLATIISKRSKYKDVDIGIKNIYPEEYYNKDNPLGDYFGFTGDSQSDVNPSVILFISNRFQWNFGKVKTGLGATTTIARANNQFIFTDIIPVMIHHNVDSVPNNYAIILDVNWNIIRGLSLSAMLGFDDINAKDFGIPDGQTPTIPGAILQLEYSNYQKKSEGFGFFQYYMLEAGYTHYLWGNFQYNNNPESWCGVYLARAIYRYTPNKSAVLLPLTSPYGPGVIWGKLTSRFNFTDLNIQVGLDLLLLFKNSHVNLVETEYERDDSLNKPDQWYVSIDIPIIYNWRYFEFILNPGIIFSKEKTLFECTLGVRFGLEGSGRL